MDTVSLLRLELTAYSLKAKKSNTRYANSGSGLVADGALENREMLRFY